MILTRIALWSGGRGAQAGATLVTFRMTQGWQSYDSAAVTHERVAVPHLFAPPAKDLVNKMDLRDEAAVLDVGTGTGVAARCALEKLQPAATVVGLDPSIGMLKLARSRGAIRVVAGQVPGLPFSESSVDAVLASFVLTHVRDYKTALLDMVRVLRPGAKFGTTAWATTSDEHREFWQSIAESFVGAKTLQAAVGQALPWEDCFTQSEHLRRALQEAGLIGVELHLARYQIRMSIADFLAMRETSIQARFMRGALDARRWEEFKQTLSAQFSARFSDPLEHTREVNIGIGKRA